VPLALGYFERIIALRQGRLIFDRPAALVRPDDLDALYALESSADTLAAAG
jgi:phosphonate transport system ATP-binding protein